MKPLTENEIRASFVNASRREAKQASLPADLETLGHRWEDARLPRLGRPQQPPTGVCRRPRRRRTRRLPPAGLRAHAQGERDVRLVRGRLRDERRDPLRRQARRAPPAARATASARSCTPTSAARRTCGACRTAWRAGSTRSRSWTRRVAGAAGAVVGLRPPRARRLVSERRAARFGRRTPVLLLRLATPRRRSSVAEQPSSRRKTYVQFVPPAPDREGPGHRDRALLLSAGRGMPAYVPGADGVAQP